MKKGRRKAKPPKDPESTFGWRIRSLMSSDDLSIRKAAEIAGVGNSTIQNWRDNHLPADPKAAKRLAEHFRISFAWLLTGEPDRYG